MPWGGKQGKRTYSGKTAKVKYQAYRMDAETTRLLKRLVKVLGVQGQGTAVRVAIRFTLRHFEK